MREIPGEKYLVFSPHADDSDIGMGGTIAKLARTAGKSVTTILVVASDTQKSTDQTSARETRMTEFKKAQGILGAHPEIWGWDREHVLYLHLRELIQKLDKFARSNEVADTWFIPAPSYDQDHRTLFEACISAARPVTPYRPKAIFKYELPTYFGNPRGIRFDPHFYVDISNMVDTKLLAVAAHESQMGQQPYMKAEAIVKWMEFRGFEAGVEAAEAFEIERLLL